MNINLSNSNPSNEEVRFPKRNARNHGGNGRKAEPGILAPEMDEVKKLQERIKEDLARFERDKAIIAKEITEIKAHLKEAQTAGQADVAKNWETRLKNVEELLRVVEKNTPPVVPISSETILKELRRYRKARQKQKLAEERVNKNEGSKAIGDYNRAQTEAVAIGQNIEHLVNEREQMKIISLSTPAQEEGIFYSAKQAEEDREIWLRNHKKITVDTPSQVPQEVIFEEDRPSKEEKDEVVVSEVVAKDDETPVVEEVIEQEVLPIIEDIPQEAPEIRLLPDPETDDALLPLITDIAIPAPSVSKMKQLGSFVHKQMNAVSSGFRSFFSEVTAIPEKISLFYNTKMKEREEKNILVPETTEDKPIIPEEAPVPEEPATLVAVVKEEPVALPDEFLEKPLFTEFELEEKPEMGTKAPEEPQEEALPPEEPTPVLQTPEAPTPLPEELLPVEETSVVEPVSEFVPPMPQEIIPGNIVELSKTEQQAEDVLREDMDKLFAVRKGPFGLLGTVSGLQSEHWVHPQTGFGANTAEAVFRAQPEVSPEGSETFGLENKEAVTKMKEYLMSVERVSEITHNENEKIDDFIRRAAIAKLSK